MSSFNRELQVLYYPLWGHEKPASSQYILWPAWAYRVVAPKVSRGNFNILQKAVFGLCRTGITRAEEIGDKLDLHSELSAFILKELMETGYIDENGNPSSRGLNAYNDDAYESHELITGYVFQDPWDGDLWPRFVERLEFCELDYNKKGYPSLILGSRGKPRRQSAFMTHCSESGTSRPSPESVITAISRFRKRMRYKRKVTLWNEDHVEGDGLEDTGMSNIQRVSFIEESPEPVYLATYAYLTDSPISDDDWYVCDPFGFGASSKLRKRIDRRIETDSNLFNWVYALFGGRSKKSQDEYKCIMNKLRIDAGREVVTRHRVNIKKHKSYSTLVDMQYSYIGARNRGVECSDHEINNILRSCTKVLESLFGAWSEEYSLKDVWKLVYYSTNKANKVVWRPMSDRLLFSGIYHAAAKAVGFDDAVPQSLLNIRPGQIKSVSVYKDNWRLRPLITATVIAAQNDLTHPLHAVALKNPKLLIELDLVASLGGKAGHAGVDEYSIAAAENAVSIVHNIVELFIGAEMIILEQMEE